MPFVAAFPNSLPTFNTKVDNIDTVFADHINILQAEVAAIATELGTNPKGASPSVKQRMVDIEATHMDLMSHFNSNGNIPIPGVEGLPAALAGLFSLASIIAKGDLLPGSGSGAVARLPVGTTGYRLTADPAAAGGMSWQAPGIAPTLVDAKGDLIGATADNTPARIPVGSTATVLTADSTAAAGVSYQAPHFPIPFHFPGNFTTGYKTPAFIAPVNMTLRLARARTSSNNTATYGVAVNGAMVTSASAAVNGTVTTFDFTDVNINAGDYVQIQIYDNSSGAAQDLSITIDAVAR